MLALLVLICYIIITMERKHIYITELQQQKLEIFARITGLSVAEIVRRALDQYFEDQSHIFKVGGTDSENKND